MSTSTKWSQVLYLGAKTCPVVPLVCQGWCSFRKPATLSQVKNIQTTPKWHMFKLVWTLKVKSLLIYAPSCPSSVGPQRLHFSPFLSTGLCLYFSLRGQTWCWTSPLLAAMASLDWTLHPWRLLSSLGSGLGKVLGAQDIIHEERLQVVSAKTGDGFCLGRETPGSWRVG